MTVNHNLLTAAAGLAALAGAAPALAQAAAPDLMALDNASLRGEVQSRLDAAIALTADPAIVAANNPRFVWASQAKAQCGIAVGYLKSGYKDPVSVSKCAAAAMQMQLVPAAPMPVAAAPAPMPEMCREPIAGIVFFEFDSAAPPASADQTMASVVQGLSSCNWQRLTVTGHADRSGADGYNDALSVRRANAVAEALGARGIDRGKLVVAGKGETEPKVPTPDGVRNPQNRRVEINAN